MLIERTTFRCASPLDTDRRQYSGRIAAMILSELRCSCGYSVPLRPSFVNTMALEERGSRERFVDWVCPHCGAGTRLNVAEVPERDFTSATEHYEVPVLHAFLSCTVENCAAHATVHTVADNGRPTLPLEWWKSVTARCYFGHPARVPLTVSGSTVTVG